MHQSTLSFPASSGLSPLSSRTNRRSGYLFHGTSAVGPAGFFVSLICFSLGFIFLGGDLLAGPQGSPPTSVQEQIARRKAQLADAEKAVAEGMKHEQEGDFEAAVLSYRTAYTGLNDAPMTRSVRQTALSRFCSASVQHAENLIQDARYEEAEAVLTLVVDEEFDPDCAAAKKLIGRLNDPEYYNRALTPEHISNVAKVTELLRKGEDFMKLALYDDALKTYHEVLRIDRTNSAARRGMERAEVAVSNHHRSSRDHTRAKMIREVDEAWETSVPLGEFTGPLITANVGERSSMQGMLDELIVPTVNLDELTLDEVVEWLTLKSRQLDPSGVGINFVLDVDGDDGARNSLVSLRLSSVPLSTVLDYVNRQTGTKTIAERFAVRLVSAAIASDVLLTKSYQIPPDFFSVAPDAAPVDNDPFAEPSSVGGGLLDRTISAQEFFEKSGVTFPEGATVMHRKGATQMTVRNTPANLALIEAMVAEARKGGQLNVEVKLTMIEIIESNLRELGYDWLLGKFNLPGSDRVFGSGGTPGNTEGAFSGETIRTDFPFVPPGDVPLGQHPITAGNRTGIYAQPGDTIDGLIRTANRIETPSGRAPSVFAVGGALTDPQAQFIIRALNQNTGTDLMSTPATVVRPGQRSKIEVHREFIYPTEYDPPEIPQDVFQSSGSFVFDPVTGGLFLEAGSNDNFPVTPAHPTAFEMRPMGTTFEVEPIIGDDGYSVNLNLAPEITRFEGFINYGSPITTGTSVLTDNRILMPVFNTVKESTNVTVFDGANIVIGGLINDSTVATDDKTPIFSDLPFFGNLFRTRTNTRERKAIIFIVKVRIIDASGRPVNQR